MKCEMTFNYASLSFSFYFLHKKMKKKAKKELNERKEKSDHGGMKIFCRVITTTAEEKFKLISHNIDY